MKPFCNEPWHIKKFQLANIFLLPLPVRQFAKRQFVEQRLQHLQQLLPGGLVGNAN